MREPAAFTSLPAALARRLRIYPLIVLGLTGCLRASPLAPDEIVSLEGKLLSETGQPAPDREVSLTLAQGQTRRGRSDAAGFYRFSFAAADTQFLGLASSLDLSVGSEDQPRLRQRSEVLKRDLSLPTMRFWNGLEAPAADAVISGERTIFSWQAPATGTPRAYAFILRDTRGERIWAANTDRPSLELPLAVMNSQQVYRWQVSADLGDYEVISAPRQLRTGQLALRSLSLRAIRSGDLLYPGLHDGSFRYLPGNSLSFSGTRPRDLELELTQSQRVSGLHWDGDGAAVEIRASRDGEPLLQHQLPSQGLLSWEPVQTDRIWLRLSAGSDSQLDINEIRVLGPAP